MEKSVSQSNKWQLRKLIIYCSFFYSCCFFSTVLLKCSDQYHTNEIDVSAVQCRVWPLFRVVHGLACVFSVVNSVYNYYYSYQSKLLLSFISLSLTPSLFMFLGVSVLSCSSIEWHLFYFIFHSKLVNLTVVRSFSFFVQKIDCHSVVKVI